MAQLALRVLGPPQVVVDGRTLAVGARSLLLLVRLSLARPAPVSRSRLLDDVWGGAGASDGALRVQVNRLRGLVGPDVIARQGDGYALAGDVFIDADRFRALCVAGRDRSSSIATRVAAFDEAIELWSAGAYDGLEASAWLRSEAMNLEELREKIVDDRFELSAMIEQPDALIADLGAAVARNPTRERRVQLLARTLYRAGRQAEALDAIRQLRAVLRDDFGLSVMGETADLEVRILNQDPTLLHLPKVAGLADDGVIEGRLRAAGVLARNGAIAEAVVIIDEVLETALASNERRTYALALLARADAAARSESVQEDHRQYIDQAQAIARQLRDGALLARCAKARIGMGVPDDLGDSLVELIEPLDLLPTAAPERLELLSFAAVAITLIDASPAADRLLEAARRSYERIGSPQAEAVWLTARSIVGSVRGAPIAETSAWAERAYELACGADEATLRVVAFQAVLRARYTLGDLVAIDGLLDVLERDSIDAGLAFGVIRVGLCRTTNALARGELDRVPELLAESQRAGEIYRTFSSAGALFAQRALWLLEMGREVELGAHVAPLITDVPTAWYAVHALCGGMTAGDLYASAEHVPADDSLWSFVALASVVAEREGHADLGAWCANKLEPLGDAVVVVGLGSLALGFAKYYRGLGLRAAGDEVLAEASLVRAGELAKRGGLRLWAGYTDAALAGLRMASGAPSEETKERIDTVGQVAAATGSVRLRRLHEQLLEQTSG